MDIILDDGKIVRQGAGKKIIDILMNIDPESAKSAVAARVDGILTDLSFRLTDDCRLSVITYDEPEGKEIFRHTAAHVLAQAVRNIYPTVMLAGGTATESGFYYDFDFKTPITINDLDKIEKEIQRIIDADFLIERQELAKRTVQAKMRNLGEDYKLKYLSGFPVSDKVIIYKQGDFLEICKGPHLLSTGRIRHLKLTSLAGAYLHGDVRNKMLTRISGAAFSGKEDYGQYLILLQEAKNRDHVKLGKELKFFTTDDSIGQGLPLMMPKGARVIQLLQRFVEDCEQSRGYEPIRTPAMAKPELFKRSSHWQFFRDGMFVIGDSVLTENDLMVLKPVTFPFHYCIYNSSLVSYKDLPVKYCETTSLFRDENSGEMHGLSRLRNFTASDAHVICRPADLESELKKVLDIQLLMIDKLGIGAGIKYRLSLRGFEGGNGFLGKPEDWERAETAFKSVLDEAGIDYCTAAGEAAFFGPKLDILVQNVWGRPYQLMSVKIDITAAEKFDMRYVAEDGTRRLPVIIRHSSAGCYERTLAYLLEYYNGALPLWLSPVQVRILTLSEKAEDYGKELLSLFINAGIRATLDARDEKIGYKIRETLIEKIPYMAIVGGKEMQNGMISVRDRKNGDMGTFTPSDFINLVKNG